VWLANDIRSRHDPGLAASHFVDEQQVVDYLVQHISREEVHTTSNWKVIQQHGDLFGLLAASFPDHFAERPKRPPPALLPLLSTTSSTETPIEDCNTKVYFPWMLKKLQVRPSFWADGTNRQAYLTWLFTQLGYSSLEDFYRLSTQTLLDNHGSLLLSCFR